MHVPRVVPIASSSSLPAASGSHGTGMGLPDRDIHSLPAGPVFVFRAVFRSMRSYPDRKHRADSERPLVTGGGEGDSDPRQHRLQCRGNQSRMARKCTSVMAKNERRPQCH
jgi:hypothetical protein